MAVAPLLDALVQVHQPLGDEGGIGVLAIDRDERLLDGRVGDLGLERDRVAALGEVGHERRPQGQLGLRGLHGGPGVRTLRLGTDGGRVALEAGDTDRALHLLNRVLKILKTLVAQVDVLETMTPLQFLSFRDRLDSASGFQSAGFRQVEALLGSRDPGAVHAQPEGSVARAAVETAQAEPALWDGFLVYLGERGHAVPDDATLPDERVQAALIAVYRGDPDAALVAERLVDLDEGVQEWRYRHVKMVERTIGTKRGTGGSSGVEYLRATLFRAAFPDLWEIRSRL